MELIPLCHFPTVLDNFDNQLVSFKPYPNELHCLVKQAREKRQKKHVYNFHQKIPLKIVKPSECPTKQKNGERRAKEARRTESACPSFQSWNLTPETKAGLSLEFGQSGFFWLHNDQKVARLPLNGVKLQNFQVSKG